MQAIHDNVTVFVTQRELQSRTPKPDGSTASTTALQYIAESAGFDTVTFRVDFSESANIKLHRPGPNAPNALQKSTQEQTFECELHPFERRVLAYVVKKAKKRAFVRVHYTVTAVSTPSIDAVVQAQQGRATKLQQLQQRSNQTFRHVSKWNALPHQPETAIDRACVEINRYFREFGEVFIDSSFPPASESLYASEAPTKLSDGDSAVYALCSWENLHNIADSSWTFVAPNKVPYKPATQELAAVSSFTSGLPSQDSFLCALSIIAPFRELWLRRWFPSLDDVENMATISVALCNKGVSWQTLLIDLFVPTFPLGRGLMAPRNADGELYAALLHKAYAKLKGSYAAVSGISTVDILCELTGCPWACCYDSSYGEAGAAESSEQLRHTVETTLSRQRRAINSPEFDVTSSLVVATLGKVDSNHRAFRLSVSSDEDSCVVLHDETGKYLRERIAGGLAKFNRDQDLTSIHLSWDQLHELEPVVWALTLGWRHEQQVRQIFLHEGGGAKMTVAISVPTLSTVTFSSFYFAHFASERGGGESQEGPEPKLQVNIAAVENDFSLTSLDDRGVVRLANASTAYRRRDGVCSKQEVRTLTAGEYVVTISAERPGRTESHPEHEPVSDKLTPDSVDDNLQLAFDCLDRGGKHELSESDVVSFLQLHERVSPSQHGKEALRTFMLQHGSAASRASKDERRLTLDDFREVYVSLAMRECNEARATSDAIRSRLRELVWQDLLVLMSNSSGDGDNALETIESRSEIDCRDIVEISCRFHSDVPLLSVASLPDEPRSLNADNSFNTQT